MLVAHDLPRARSASASAARSSATPASSPTRAGRPVPQYGHGPRHLHHVVGRQPAQPHQHLLEIAREPSHHPVRVRGVRPDPSASRARSSWRSSSGLPGWWGGRRRRTGRRLRVEARRTSSAVASADSAPAAARPRPAPGGARPSSSSSGGRSPVAHRGHDQHRHAVEPAGEVGEEAQRGGVAPLQVVDGEHQRAVGREVDRQPVQPVQDGEGRRPCRRRATSNTPRAPTAAPRQQLRLAGAGR